MAMEALGMVETRGLVAMNKIPLTCNQSIAAIICRKDILFPEYLFHYLGSKYEAQMMRQASEMILHAHQNGMIAILWIYPRGQAIKNEREANLLAGAAGVGAALGADFIKINPPISESLKKNGELLMQATQAAGKSRVICAGGSLKDEKAFLQELYDQIYIGGTSGCAVGRNIFQKDVSAAIKFCDSIASVVFDGKIR